MALGQDSQIILEGIFSKKGALSASRWKQRYFVLYHNNTLTYAESQTSAVIHEIDLKDVEYVRTDIKNRIIMKTANKQKERIWFFAFETQHLRDLWKNELMRCTKYNAITDFVDKKQDIEEKRQFIEELTINAHKLKQNIEMKKRRHSFTVYPRCFVGSQAVEVLIELNIASITNTEEAVAFGNLLIKHHIIRSIGNTPAFTNGSFYYYFTHVNRNVLDLESVVDNADNSRDILNLIRRCESDMDSHLHLKLETLYQTLCHKFESAQHYIQYETFLDQLGKIDALKHFMDRHRFLVVPNDAVMDSKYLNQHCQLIHYDEPRTLQYNLTYLQTTQNHLNIDPSIIDLKRIHAMKDIQLFAALPIPNHHPFISSDAYYEVYGEQNQFLFRLLRNHDECDTNNEWNAKYRFAYEEWTLYEMEQYLGLFFYKTIREFVSHKLKHNKVPIPWRHKIKIKKQQRTLSEFGENKYDHGDTSTLEIFERIVSGKDEDFPHNLNMFNVLILVWLIYRNHSKHIQHSDNMHQKELKLTIFTKFVHKLCKEFFMAFHTRQHLAKYILTLHYFASNALDDINSVNAYTQSHMFEMALNAIKDSNSGLCWRDKRKVIEFLHEHSWIQYYKKRDSNVQFYLEKELKRVEDQLTDVYSTLTQHRKFKRIESEIKIICGNIIFRQDHPQILASNWFDAKRLIIKRKFINETKCNTAAMDRAGFEEECAHIMWNIAKYLSPQFSQWLQRIFCDHDGVQVFELNVKSMERVKEELCLMANKNIKFPKSGSIRDYMRCLVVFPSIEDMLNGYEALKQCSKRNSKMFRLVHMDNGIGGKHKRIVDNFRVIHIHTLFSQQHPKYGSVTLIGEICFCFQSIFGVYGMKKYIVDSYSLLLTPPKAYQTAKSMSVSKEHPDYDCLIQKLQEIQEQYLRSKSLIK